MLKSLYGRLKRLVAVPDDPALVCAQFHVFTRLVPLMYAIMLVNAWALSFIAMPTAPTWITVYMPCAFTVVSILRLLGWWRSRGVKPTPEVAHRALVRTNQFAALLSAIITGWALSMVIFGDPELTGNVAFFMAITGVSVVVCLMHMRSSAVIAATAINIPFVVYFSLSSDTAIVIMAINMMFVSLALIVVVFVQSGHFASAVEARTELEVLNEENWRLANLDSLTDLNNRRQFFSHLGEAFFLAQDSGQRLAVGIIDLDGFKPVNDLYGHVVGDALLMEVARRLAPLGDAATHVYRLGGDEFAMLFADCADNDTLLERGEQVCAAMRAPFVLPDVTLRISASMGLSVYPDLAETAHQLYERADYALYNGKRAMRGHATLFSAEHVLQIEQSLQIEQVLRDADLKREMSVQFQPIIDSHTGRTVGLEALSRWTSPVLGKVSPKLFIPVAERAGLVTRLTRILLEKALAAAMNWPEDVRLSFNLSTHDISSAEGVMRIVSVITSSGVDPRRLDLEITETAMMYDFAQAKESIESLRRLGCGIALDDFGTGYSSLSQLHALPLTEIKIDRSFVSGIDRSPASYKIVKSLLALSRDMGLDCVVEGVETDAELATLAGIGGRLVQGFYFAEPLPEAEVANFLRTGPTRFTG